MKRGTMISAIGAMVSDLEEKVLHNKAKVANMVEPISYYIREVENYKTAIELQKCSAVYMGITIEEIENNVNSRKEGLK